MNNVVNVMSVRFGKMKFFLLVIIFFIMVFSCKTFDKKILIKTDTKEISFEFKYADNILINGKQLLDVSSDLVLKDVTDDKIKKKYIYKIDRINDLLLKEMLIRKVIYNNLSGYLKESNIKLTDLRDSTSDKAHDIEYKLKIDLVKYDQGEYNLIYNLPSKYYLNIVIERKNARIAMSRKNYTVNSDIYFPTEKLRIDEVSQKITKDLILAIKDALFWQKQNEPDATSDKNTARKKVSNDVTEDKKEPNEEKE